MKEGAPCGVSPGAGTVDVVLEQGMIVVRNLHDDASMLGERRSGTWSDAWRSGGECRAVELIGIGRHQHWFGAHGPRGDEPIGAEGPVHHAVRVAPVHVGDEFADRRAEDVEIEMGVAGDERIVRPVHRLDANRAAAVALVALEPFTDALSAGVRADGEEVGPMDEPIVLESGEPEDEAGHATVGVKGAGGDTADLRSDHEDRGGDAFGEAIAPDFLLHADGIGPFGVRREFADFVVRSGHGGGAWVRVAIGNDSGTICIQICIQILPPEQIMRKFIVGVMVVAACRAPVVTGTVGSAAAPENAPYDLVVTNGRVVDGTGSAWFWGDIGVRGDRIARIAPRGTLASASAARHIDAHGLVVAPGFIDIQAQSYDNFMNGDGRALSMITQGITTAILGEGDTPAPVNGKLLETVTDTQALRLAKGFGGDHGFGRWLDFMAARGVSQNVGSFVGSGTVRAYAKGAAMTPFTASERDTVRAMVARTMKDGAFGIASALMYPPDNYNTTDDLIFAAKAMAPFGGLYITHMRNEGDHLLEAIDEAIQVGKEGGVATEIYHLKAAGMRNWPKMPAAIAKIDAARAVGQDVQADMYLYVAGANGFASCIAPKYAADGKLLANLRDPVIRAQVKADLQREIPGFENSCLEDPSKVMVVGFTKPELTQYEGKRVTEIAAAMGKHWTDVVIDLNLAENAGLSEILFRMSEENVALQIKQPWMKFGTDAGSEDPATARGLTHPRAYGNFTRLFGKYVREEHVIPLEEAVRKASSAVATRLSLGDRGVLKTGLKADIVVFDPNTIADKATFDKPHQLSVGIEHVIVNGVSVILDGKHTGAKPGQVVRGPAWDGSVSRK